MGERRPATDTTHNVTRLPLTKAQDAAKEPNLRPKVSVVIPTYNRAKLVIIAIESVLAQTYPVHDIIVVDDGSTDDTPFMLETACEAKPHMRHVVRYFRQENRGQSVARNKGLEEAQAEWVAFLDSDDIWLPEKLEYQLRALHEFENESDACFTDVQFTGTSHVRPTVFELRGEEDRGLTGLVPDSMRLLLDRARTPPVWLPTLITKTHLARAVGGFDPKLRFGEDEDFLFRLVRETRFCFVNKPLLVVDRSPAQGRHTGPNAVWDRVEFRLAQNQYRYEKQLRLSEGMPRYVRRSILKDLGAVHSGWANWFLQNGHLPKSKEAISAALKCRLSIRMFLKYLLLRLGPSLVLRLVSFKSRQLKASGA